VLLPALTLMPLTVFGDRNESTPPVSGMRLPANEPILLERFDQDGYSPWANSQSRSQLTHRELTVAMQRVKQPHPRVTYGIGRQTRIHPPNPCRTQFGEGLD
jgi:hypothetical protein